MLKAPLPGQVKTRLATSMGAEAACQAYKRLVEHQLRQVPASWCIEIHGTPELALLEQWLGGIRSMTFHPQVSGDLGARMQAAAQSAFGRGAQSVVLLGGDCAELDTARLTALELALHSAPVAIIPALDGGYVALAMSRLEDCLFKHMPWSQATLMETTRTALSRHHIPWVELPSCWDVDELADWEAALPLLAHHVANASRENSSGLTQLG